MHKTRVLVVDDSVTVRKRLCEVLAADPELEVVGEAADGKEAIALCLELRPNAITMDMMMPVMSGLAATEYIMAHAPTPILVVSSSTNRAELFKTYEALSAGALDVLEKPGDDEPLESWEAKLVSTVKLIARIRVITHPRARLGGYTPHSSSPPPIIPQAAGAVRKVIAIGASTGGPSAIVDVLRGLPADFTLPVLLVLHIGVPFGAAFADWLDGQTPRRVSFAKDGERLSGADGRVVMAPPDHHMVVHDGRLHLTRDAERHSCRPSVDVLFESVARALGAASAACILTGMGRDGAAGLLEVRRAGGVTIGQDEASSVVYGMPREAKLLGATEHVLPLGEIGAAIARLCSGSGRAS